MYGLRHAFKAVMLLLGLLLILAAFSQLLRTGFHSALLGSYRHSFSWSPGSHFGRSIATLRREQGRPCVILGNSAAREGVDTAALAAALPGRRFVNAATTGGNNLVFELQARMLAAHETKARCVILMMNSWNMFSGGRPQIAGDDYLALLDWQDLAALSYRPLTTREAPRLAMGLLLPLKPQGEQLSRMVRRELWHWRTAAGDPVPISRFAYFAGELDPPDTYLYHGKNILLDQWPKLVARNREYYDPARYGGHEERASLGAALQTLSTISPETILVILPQSSILERASRIADPAFRQALAPYRSKITLIDCSALDDPTLFYDEGHLNARGRATLSGELARVLAGGEGQCHITTPNNRDTI